MNKFFSLYHRPHLLWNKSISSTKQSSGVLCLTLHLMVGCLCKQAAIPDFNMNLSLRVTSATRGFSKRNRWVAHTGHRRIDGVRCYKRIGEDQKKTISSVLNSATNGKQFGAADENVCPMKSPRISNPEASTSLQQCKTSLTTTRTRPI